MCARLLRRHRAEIDKRQIHGELGQYSLPWLAALVHERRAQRGVPRDQLREGLLQPGHVQRPLQPPPSSNVVGRTAGLPLIQEPQPLLRKGKWQAGPVGKVGASRDMLSGCRGSVSGEAPFKQSPLFRAERRDANVETGRKGGRVLGVVHWERRRQGSSVMAMVIEVAGASTIGHHRKCSGNLPQSSGAGLVRCPLDDCSEFRNRWSFEYPAQGE